MNRFSRHERKVKLLDKFNNSVNMDELKMIFLKNSVFLMNDADSRSGITYTYLT